MNLKFQIRSLLFFWRTNAGVMLGAAVGAAVLTGSLLVGDSMRESLRQMILGRLGRVDAALVAPQYFGESLVAPVRLPTRSDTGESNRSTLILISASITNADETARANRAKLFGVDDRFWKLSATALPIPFNQSSGAILNQPLADELGIKPGDAVLLYMSKPSDAPLESLLGRRDETTASMRLEVAGVIPARDLGGFDVNPRQTLPFNAFVPLADLQRSLHRGGKANAILAAGEDLSVLQADLTKNAALPDYGLSLRADEHGYISLESERMLISPAAVKAAFAAATHLNWTATPIIAYLANFIENSVADTESTSQRTRSVPYSTVVAIDPTSNLFTTLLASTTPPEATAMGLGDIALNQWTADQLGAKPGDHIRLSYYISGDFGRLETDHADFTLRAVLPMSSAVTDPGFVPQYHGITDAKSLSDWNPPFPVDLTRIRPADEDYWKQYHTAPKAFVTIADGEKLWAHQADRFGKYTSIRIQPPSTGGTSGATHADQTAKFESTLLKHLKPADFGLSFEPIRQKAIDAAQGSTDFGMLFVSFSFFLIIVAAMLVALLFRLGIERRSAEIGLLLAAGYRPRSIAMGLIGEGTLVAIVGGVLGSILAGGYAWLMLSGLRTWWSAGLNSTFLELHASMPAYVEGLAGSIAIAVFSIFWSVRGLTRRSPRSLLAGQIASDSMGSRSRGRLIASLIAAASALGAMGLTAWSYSTGSSQVASFFAAGGLLLLAGVAALARWLSGAPRSVVHRPGLASILRLAVRNAARHRGRSLLTASLFAAATFLIVSLESLRSDANELSDAKNSGTGGFNLIAESTVPILADLNDPRVRDDFGIDSFGNAQSLAFTPFRLRPGDQSSCLNLYQPRNPRILGTTDAMISRGGFEFAGTIEASEAEKKNPWLLLNRKFEDGAIPAIGDEAAVQWQMHLGLGSDLQLTDEGDRPIRLRFVALLKESAVQDEVFISESQFVHAFPSISGYSFFLIECPASQSAMVEPNLEKALTRFGFDAVKAKDRLARYMAVQNTYLSTFQTLGGIALILGAAGLSAVMLRNIWERRAELGLLQTVGYSRRLLVVFVLAENLGLLLAALLVGTVAALVAVAPHVYQTSAAFPWTKVVLSVAGTIAVGSLTAFWAATRALRSPLIASLRGE